MSKLRVGEFALVDVWRVQSCQAGKAQQQEQPPSAVVGKHNCVHLEGEKETGESAGEKGAGESAGEKGERESQLFLPFPFCSLQAPSPLSASSHIQAEPFFFW